jgi:hypothetical protein
MKKKQLLDHYQGSKAIFSRHPITDAKRWEGLAKISGRRREAP